MCASLLCRLAAQHGLAWLQGNYWQRQSDHEHASTDKVRALVQVRREHEGGRPPASNLQQRLGPVPGPC